MMIPEHVNQIFERACPVVAQLNSIRLSSNLADPGIQVKMGTK